MKFSSSAFSVYNNVKKIFLEFSDGKHYKGMIIIQSQKSTQLSSELSFVKITNTHKHNISAPDAGHIDSEKLQQALSAALGKEFSQDEVDRALQAFQEERGDPVNVGDDNDASTANGSCDTQSIRMPEFLVLMVRL